MLLGVDHDEALQAPSLNTSSSSENETHKVSVPYE